jgi:hypothetical protein
MRGYRKGDWQTGILLRDGSVGFHVQMAAFGTSRHFTALRNLVAIEAIADVFLQPRQRCLFSTLEASLKMEWPISFSANPCKYG